jgi:hypothetical protein
MHLYYKLHPSKRFVIVSPNIPAALEHEDASIDTMRFYRSSESKA